MNILHAFTNQFNGGQSWIFVVIIFVVSILVCYAMCYRRNIISDWAFEPIVAIPKPLQKTPIVKTWFNLTRGHNYVTKLSKDQNAISLINAPATPVKMDALFSGWAFTHALQHFMIAFMCPKLAFVSFLAGIGWEILESVNHSHCALDILWNMCGCLLGLLVRTVLFPEPK